MQQVYLVACIGSAAIFFRSLGCRPIFVSTIPLGPAGTFTAIDQ